jgi:RimJ/RimL family protein N-acetyltransferase
MSLGELVSLQGEHVSLVPLTQEHHDDLVEAVRDGELWNLWYTSVPAPDGVRAEIERRLGLNGRGSMVPFAVLEKPSLRAVGMTTYMNIDAGNRRLEIGSTWYRRRVQRTALNTECKLLLLTHAFERLGCIAVELRTHFFNQQSRAAIERLGAKHQIGRDGVLRDSCVYSVLDREWPAVKAHLLHHLGRTAAVSDDPAGRGRP